MKLNEPVSQKIEQEQKEEHVWPVKGLPVASVSTSCIFLCDTVKLVRVANLLSQLCVCIK